MYPRHIVIKTLNKQKKERKEGREGGKEEGRRMVVVFRKLSHLIATVALSVWL